MKIFAAFPSKYLKAADLHDKHVSATMSHVMLEELPSRDGPQLLPILYFQGVSKGMVINKTRAKAIAEAYTDETENWIGMPIVLFPAMVAFGAETVEAIRVKAPSKAERSRAWHDGNREALAEHTHQQWEKHEGDKLLKATVWQPVSATPADMERARQVFDTKKPTPRPKVTPLAEAMAIHAENGVEWDETAERLRAPGPRRDNEAAPEHDEDGVVWDAGGERPLTDEEKVEAFRQSLQRVNAAMDERIARGPSKVTAKDDGLDIPKEFRRQRVVPIQQSMDYRWSKPAI